MPASLPEEKGALLVGANLAARFLQRRLSYMWRPTKQSTIIYMQHCETKYLTMYLCLLSTRSFNSHPWPSIIKNIDNRETDRNKKYADIAWIATGFLVDNSFLISVRFITISYSFLEWCKVTKYISDQIYNFWQNADKFMHIILCFLLNIWRHYNFEQYEEFTKFLDIKYFQYLPN